MIIRRYGNRFHSVSINFDPAAMTEVGFRRDGEQEWEAEEFMDEYELLGEEEIIAEFSHAIQETAEREMLAALEAELHAVREALEEGHLLSIESKAGVDHPRTRYDRPTTGDKAFTYTLDKPLRLGIWRRRATPSS